MSVIAVKDRIISFYYEFDTGGSAELFHAKGHEMSLLLLML